MRYQTALLPDGAEIALLVGEKQATYHVKSTSMDNSLKNRPMRLDFLAEICYILAEIKKELNAIIF
jgi:hypothetical protein